MTKYQCSISKLEFPNQELADRCEEWCATSNSCNLEIGRQALRRNYVEDCCDARLSRQPSTDTAR